MILDSNWVQLSDGSDQSQQHDTRMGCMGEGAWCVQAGCLYSMTVAAQNGQQLSVCHANWDRRGPQEPRGHSLHSLTVVVSEMRWLATNATVCTISKGPLHSLPHHPVSPYDCGGPYPSVDAPRAGSRAITKRSLDASVV